MGINSHYTVNFSQLYKYDPDEIGKNAHQLGELTHLGVPIPDGFVILPSLFKKFLEETKIAIDIEKIQAISHPAISDSMPKLLLPIKNKIMHTHIPQDLATKLHGYYKKLSGIFKETSLNIFTSPLKGKSLQFFNVKGDANFILTIKKIWAMQVESSTAIIVQKNIPSKIQGKIITENPLTHEESWVLSDVVSKIKKYFYFPQEVEYALFKGKIYITDIKPFTKIPEIKIISPTVKQRKILIKGVPLNPGIITGSVRLLRNQDYYQVKSHEIAVIPEIDKLLYSKIVKAKAIIVDMELRNPYDRVMYKKSVKKPTIMGTQNAIRMLRNGNIITINGANGEIYSGGLIH